MSDRPLILGPDAAGLALVIAGDRVCWSGAGEPPRMPGALPIRCPDAVIVAGNVAWVEGDLDGIADPAALRERAAAIGSRLLDGGSTSAIVLVRPAAGSEDGLAAAAAGLRKAGLRAALAAVADDRMGGAGRALEAVAESRRFILANRDAWIRGAAAWDPGASPAARAAAEALAGETGCVAIEAGRLRPAGEAASLLGRIFGRRAGELEPGATGDAAAMREGVALVAIVGGRIVRRDGKPGFGP